MGELGPNAGLVGRLGGLRELTTPALVVEAEAFERNVQGYQRRVEARGLRARPHAKSHKCVEVARRQMAAGAVGVCAASLHEAEALVGRGVGDVLITSPVVGAGKVERLVRLLGEGAAVAAVVDDEEQALRLAASTRAAGRVLPVLVDVDLGMGRTGVPTREGVLRLADVVSGTEGLRYGGLQAYSGVVQHIADFGERDAVYSQQLRWLNEIVTALGEQGLAPRVVSGGGTGTLAIDLREGVLTELQTGSYVFMDVEYNAVALGGREPDGGFGAGPMVGFETALFVYSTVISRPVRGQVTVDAGLKSFATDGPLPRVRGGAPEGTVYEFFGDEHGRLTFPEGSEGLPLGAMVKLETPHCDPTVNLHDVLHVVRGEVVEAIWRIEGRGVL